MYSEELLDEIRHFFERESRLACMDQRSGEKCWCTSCEAKRILYKMVSATK